MDSARLVVHIEIASASLTKIYIPDMFE